MAGPIPTESNINMTGAGLVGKSASGAGKSGRMSQSSVLSWLGLSASGVTDGKALIASSNSIAWSPSAAALLPDTLPAVGTLLSYGGSRQLAAGGTVSHSGAITANGAVNFQNGSGVTYAGWTGSSRIFWAGGDAFAVRTSTGGTYLHRDGFLAVTNSTDASSATADTFLSRESAGVWRMGTTSTGSDAGFKCGAITASTITATSPISVTLGVSPININNPGINVASGTLFVGSNNNQIWLCTSGTNKWQVNTFGTLTANGALGIVTTGTISSGAITASGDITLAASQRLYMSNGALTGNYLLSGATAAFANNSVAQGGWNTNGMYARKLFIDYVNADICLARASASNLGIYAADGTTPAAVTCGAITCGAITASGAVMETPTQSTINPTTVNIPTGQRRGWYNSTLAEFRDWVNIGGTLLKSAAYT